MRTAAITLLILFTTTFTIAQSKLGRAKNDLSGTSSKQSYTTNSDSQSSSEDGNGLVEGIVIETLYFVTYGILIGDIQPRSFYAYPYAEGQHGEYYPIENHGPGIKGNLILSNTLAFQSGTFANDLKLNYRFIPVLGLEANHLHFFDKLSEDTELGISSIMLNYFRIRERHVTGYWGLGATYVGNEVDTWGFSYNLGLDIYVAHPISLSVLWKQSFINESSINEFQGLVKYHLKRFSIHGGFIHYTIGEENFPSAAVGISYGF